jgi:hypothetical protein
MSSIGNHAESTSGAIADVWWSAESGYFAHMSESLMTPSALLLTFLHNGAGKALLKTHSSHTTWKTMHK